MQTKGLQNQRRTNHPGSALFALLAIIAIVCIILAVQWWLKTSAKDPDTSELLPWKEWKLREVNPKPKQEPYEEQAAIQGPMTVDVNARLKGDRDGRGEMRLIITPDGLVKGSWYGDYYNKSKVNFDIMEGGFEGKTYPRKIYRDEDGEDDSKLYFITKGDFLLQETNFEKDKVFHRGGEIYVRGWIEPDYMVTGEIIITSNKKYYETFTWKGKLSKLKNMFNFMP